MILQFHVSSSPFLLVFEPFFGTFSRLPCLQERANSKRLKATMKCDNEADATVMTYKRNDETELTETMARRKGCPYPP